jgi:hypothetical protein
MVQRHARTIGTIILAIGLAVLASFSYYAFAGYGDFQKARMFRERNPGNAMYDLEYGRHAAQLAFLVGGAFGGVLLALNGLTWLALGGAARDAASTRAPARP